MTFLFIWLDFKIISLEIILKISISRLQKPQIQFENIKRKDEAIVKEVTKKGTSQAEILSTQAKSC